MAIPYFLSVLVKLITRNIGEYVSTPEVGVECKFSNKLILHGNKDILEIPPQPSEACLINVAGFSFLRFIKPVECSRTTNPDL